MTNSILGRKKVRINANLSYKNEIIAPIYSIEQVLTLFCGRQGRQRVYITCLAGLRLLIDLEPEVKVQPPGEAGLVLDT